MLVNIQWLKECVAFDYSVEELSSHLTMAGLEVKSISPVSQCDDRIVVGEVKSATLIDETNHISLCRVDVGQDADVRVVCGAPNVRPNGKYPLALLGSKVGDRTIAEVEIYSEESAGMLCSAAELGLGDATGGLLELDATASVGQTLNAYLNLEDFVLDLELTPNRADCLSIRGVAREIAILANTQIKSQNLKHIEAQSGRGIPVQIENPEDCPVFCRRVIDNIKSDAGTPDWMKQRLQRVGLRSIHPIVDITNYVMMETGQPMHAFDTEVIDSSEIIVRHSRAGEKLVLLDGESLDLGPGMLMITDRNGPIALAGVMGGEFSGIGEQTSSIMLEAAFFSPHAIRRSVSKFGMHTDASHRFERGVDPTGQWAAIERATELILEITGGVPGPTQEIRFDQHVETKQPCLVRHSRVNRVLGLDLDYETVESVMHAVNESVTSVEAGWNVVPPAYRFDLTEEHDQVEEVARVYGYDKVPTRMNFEPGMYRNLSEKHVSLTSVRDTLHSLGYYEAITYSFVDPALQQKIQPSANGFYLSNPIAENLSVMRTSLWPGLIGSFLENYRRGKESIRLYEIGRIFPANGEINKLGALIYGNASPTQWGVQQRKVDFFDLKGDLERLIELTGISDQLEFKSEHVDGLHPGRSSSIYLNGNSIGVVGQVHPDVLDEVNSREAIYVFEMVLDVILSRSVTSYKTISRYPAVSRDLSLVIKATQNVAEVTEAIEQSAGNSLESLSLFDVYFDIDSANTLKSVTYRLIFRSNTRTLTDVEVESSVQQVLSELHRRFDATLRE